MIKFEIKVLPMISLYCKLFDEKGAEVHLLQEVRRFTKDETGHVVFSAELPEGFVGWIIKDLLGDTPVLVVNHIEGGESDWRGYELALVGLGDLYEPDVAERQLHNNGVPDVVISRIKKYIEQDRKAVLEQ